MAAELKERRLELLRGMLTNETFLKSVKENPKRISDALGFCDTGGEITKMVAKLLELFKNNESLLDDILKIVSGVLAAQVNKK
ncbi:hypothetical protein POV27_04585 [Aureisphaera galaxeae]|uniref:hypothetical protein n=1 Tax=Aureisphaera galaxeae TaxID=1538023 RepID=UPI002350F299|nr:hypothetical protein [Aureisphaera galaxeae]MDC8003314.1 hypothetical protein [Aureisphaera galaxeae]